MAARPRAEPRARAPSLSDGLLVARARVRETPSDSSQWIELADLLYRRGDFDLASRAYRRVQELCSFGPVARRADPMLGSGPLERAVQRARSGEDVPALTPNLPPFPTFPPSARATGPGGPPSLAGSGPKVPILTSESGRTRAIRLPGTGILVARSSVGSPSAVVTEGGLRASEDARSGPGAQEVTGDRPRAPTVQEKIRAILQADLERFLEVFERPPAGPAAGESTLGARGDPRDPRRPPGASERT